jgi:shikimate dehydrogenase
VNRVARHAVFGSPIAHSLSPRIHAAFAAQAGLAIDYRAIEATRASFAPLLAAFADAGGTGANVTLPLKEDAALLCGTLSGRARRCDSVNTLLRRDAGWHGDSTDGEGLLRDLAQAGFDLPGARVLLLGAGGAARAVALALDDGGAGAVTVANRDPARAARLAAVLGGNARAVAWSALEDVRDVDLVINATAAGHAGGQLAVPAAVLAAATLCYDLSYGAAAAPFLAQCRAAGAPQVSDGLGMLVSQAAASFALWHGVQPDTAPVLARLRVEASA